MKVTMSSAGNFKATWLCCEKRVDTGTQGEQGSRLGVQRLPPWGGAYNWAGAVSQPGTHQETVPPRSATIKKERKKTCVWVGTHLLFPFKIFSLAPKTDVVDSFRGFDKLPAFFKYLNIYSADTLISTTVRTSLGFLTGDTQKAQSRFICR